MVRGTFPQQQKDVEAQRKMQHTFKQRPLISVVVPTYNTDPRLLRDCLDSVLAQTYDNWQLCVADDASSDAEVRKSSVCGQRQAHTVCVP